MRKKVFAILVATALIGATGTGAMASMFSATMGLKTQLTKLAFSEPALAPAAFPRFCREYPSDCRASYNRFRPTRLRMNSKSWADLTDVNQTVNSTIHAEELVETVSSSHWIISPQYGNCHDFAVTKRHMLIQRGIASRHLLLAEVVTSWGEHHLVLVVRTTKGDMVLDNLNQSIRPWRAAAYSWVRMQLPENPIYWSKVAPARSTVSSL